MPRGKAAAPTPGTYQVVPVTNVDANPDNPRREIGGVGFPELVASIERVGILEPLVVRSNGTGDTFQLISGHRRLAAALRAGLADVPVIVRDDLDEPTRVAAALIENLHRADLDPIEEADGFRQLMTLGWKQADIASAVGRSPGHVSKRLRLLDLPAEVQDLVSDDDITVEIAYELGAAAKKHGVDAVAVASDLMDRDPSHRADALDRVVADQAKENARNRFAGELVREGHVRIAGKEKWGFFTPSVQGAVPVGRGWSTQGRIDFDDNDAHVAEPCAQFSVDHDGERPAALWWCVDPGRHMPKGESKLKADSEDQRRHREKEKEKEQAARDREVRKHRRAFIDHLFTDPAAQGQIDGDAVLSKALEVLVERLEVNVAKVACGYLKLEAPTQGGEYGGNMKDWRSPLESGVAQDTIRTLLAIAIAHGEIHTEASYVAADSPRIAEHLAFLTGLGMPTPATLFGGES